MKRTLLLLLVFILIRQAGFGRSFTLPYFDDFESGAPGWYQTSNNPGCNWELGTPAYGMTTGAFSGSNCWDINLNGPYLNNTECILYSPTFDFTGTYQADITFWVNFNIERIFDLVLFQYSVDHGDSWIYYNIPGMYSNDGMSHQWTKASFSTTAFAGHDQVVFRFVFTSDGSITADGYSIDDFNIKAMTVGFTDPLLTGKFSLYPNPSNGIVRAVFDGLNPDIIEVLDGSGKLIRSIVTSGTHNATFNLQGSPAGTYYVRSRYSDAVVTRKLLLVH